jgi:catalase-peroxidase
LIKKRDITSLKKQILASGLSIDEMVLTAWASASTFRATDRKGGANGARIRFQPQQQWAVNKFGRLEKVLAIYGEIQSDFNAKNSKKQVSIADLIVLGGNTAIEEAAKNAGYKIIIPFTPGRMDATEYQTDLQSMEVLEPLADGFRNYRGNFSKVSTEALLIEKAHLLSLTAPEMTVLIGGMRVLGANYDYSTKGVFTDKKDTLSNDYFINLLDMNIAWKPTDGSREFFEGRDRISGKLKYNATRIDLIFGSNSELRAIAEVYASYDGKKKFITDFVAAWNKVMNLDRFDIEH